MTNREQYQIPTIIISKLVNRRRRLGRLKQMGMPPSVVAREAVLVDKALDELCAWAEEHAPHIFYNTKTPDECP